MAIKKKLRDKSGKLKKDSKGNPITVTVPSFSYAPNDGLAQLIVNAWTNQNFESQLLERQGGKPTAAAVNIATGAVNSAGGFNLQRAVVISEAEHDGDYEMQADNEVVFVLPNGNRTFAGTGLLETARLLMACTPNGI